MLRNDLAGASRLTGLSALSLALLAALLAPSTGCGGGSSSSGGVGVAGGAARAPSYLGVRASQAVPRVGTTFTVVVSADRTVRDVYGGGFEVRYDPAIVEHVSTDTSASKMTATKDASALRGGKAGTLVFGRTQEGAAPPGDVTGEIARFTFRAKAAGTSSIAVAAPQFLNGTGGDIAMSAPPAVSVAVAP